MGDDAAAVASLAAVLAQGRPLGEALLRDGQQLALRVHHLGLDQPIPALQFHAPHAACSQAHGPHLALLEADGASLGRDQDHLAVAPGVDDPAQAILLLQADHLRLARSSPDQVPGGDALDHALLRGQEEGALGLIRRHSGQHHRRGDALAASEAGELRRVLASPLGDLVDRDPSAAAIPGEEVEVVPGVGREESHLRVGGQLAQARLAGRGEGVAAELAVGPHRHPDHLVRQQVRGGEGALGPLHDLGAPGVPVGLLQSQELLLDHPQHLLGVPEQGLQVADELLQLLVLVLELAPFQGSQPLQGHVQDGLGLGLGELEVLPQVEPGRLHPLAAADGGDDLIQDVQGLEQPLHDVGPGPGFGQIVLGAAAHDLLAVLDEELEHAL